MDRSRGSAASPGADSPDIRFRNLVVVGEDGAARYLVGREDGGERVAVVVARPRSGVSAEVQTAQALARVAAAQRAAELPIDAAAPVRAVGRSFGGHPFVASALSGGVLLSELDGLEMPEALVLLADAAAVLAAAHAQGIVHGSVSPHTILLTADGVVQLHGFGISTTAGATRGRVFAGAARDDVRALARVTRDVLGDVFDAPVPADVSALLARAESQQSPVSAGAFAAALARAAGAEPPVIAQESIPPPDGGDVVPDDARPESRRWRLAVVTALAAGAALFLMPLGDQAERRGLGEESADSSGLVAEQVEAAGAMAFDSSGAVGDSAVRPEALLADTAVRSAETVDEPDEAPPELRRGRRSVVVRAPPAPPLSEGAFATVPADTRFTLIAGERVCGVTHDAGRRFGATMERAVDVSGQPAIPAGSPVTLVVTSADRGRNATDALRVGIAVLQLVVDGVAYPLDAAITAATVERAVGSSGDRDAGGVGRGNAALLGGILGPDRPGGGGLAGTLVTLGTRQRPGCIPAGGTIELRLDRPLRMPVN